MNKEKKKMMTPSLRFPEFREAGAWEEKTLGQIGNFIGGGTPDTSNPDYWDGDIQWFTPTEVKEQYLSKSKRTITQKGLQSSSAKLLPEGTLLVSTRATVGDVGIASNPCATNQGFQSLLVNDSEINVFWYYWLIQHKDVLVRRSSGSTFPEIGKSEIIKISVLRPKKPEQQKIAATLTSLDDLIAAQSDRISALQRHKKGLMQRLFPAEGETVPRLRFREFEGDGEWVEKTLGQLGDVLMCKRIFAEETNANGGVPFFKIGTLGGKPDAFIAKELFDDYKSKYNYPRKGEILITCSGTVGKCLTYNGEEAYYQDSNIVWIDNSSLEIMNELLYYILTNVNWGKLNSTTITRIYGSDLRNLKIVFPNDPAEQQKIATLLSTLDDLIAAQSEKLETLKKHKKGLMQGLFPGVGET